MNPFNDIEINDYFTDDEQLVNDIRNIKEHLLIRLRISKILKNLISLGIAGSVTFVFFKYINRLISVLPLERRFGIYSGTIFFTLIFIIIFRLLYNMLVLRIQNKLLDKDHNVLRRSIHLKTLKCLYEDLVNHKMNILHVDDNTLYVSSILNGERREFHIPVVYQLFNDEYNHMDFYNDHIEIYLSDLEVVN